MIINLPFPPTSNTYWRHIVIQGRPRSLISKKGREYTVLVGHVVANDFGDMKPLEGRLKVVVQLYPPDRRKRDLDNFLKALFDAISKTEKIWVDDSQIDHVTIIREKRCEGGRAVVTIEEM